MSLLFERKVKTLEAEVKMLKEWIAAHDAVIDRQIEHAPKTITLKDKSWKNANSQPS